MSEISIRFEELKKNYNKENVDSYIDFVENCRCDSVIESFKFVFSEPLEGAEFAERFLASHLFSTDELNQMKSSLESYISKAEEDGYDNYNHLETLKECLSLIEMHEELKPQIGYDDLMLEAVGLVDSDFEEKCKKVKDRVYNAYNLEMYKAALYTLYESKIHRTDYTLESALSYCNEEDHTIGEKIKKLDDLITEFYIKLAFGKDDDDCIELVDNMLKANILKESIVKKDLLTESFKIKEEPDEDYELDDELDEFEDFLEDEFEEIDELLEEEFVEESSKSKPNEKDNERKDKKSKSPKIKSNKKGKMRATTNKVAHKLKVGMAHVKNGGKQTGQAAKALKNHIDKASDSLDDAASNVVNKTRDKYRKDIREDIIEGQSRVRLGKALRNAIINVGAWAINPIFGAITTLGSLALRKTASEKERRLILQELEDELEIVNEKIEDARGDTDKENKYKLIRIKKKLEREITRVSFRIKPDTRGI